MRLTPATTAKTRRPNWGELGKAWHGLERMRYKGQPAFEILEVRASREGFDIVLTEALAPSIELSPDSLSAKQWFYYPTEQYGGPKYNEQALQVESAELSDDRRRISLRIPGLQAGYLVYLALDQGLKSESGATLWASEAWYTLNAIPASDGP